MRAAGRIWPWAVAGALLLLPLAAMRFTAAVSWDLADFLVAGSLLFGACVAYELAAGMGTAYRAAGGMAAIATVGLVWINLAVGIIGSEDNPANLMFAGVLAVAIIGAISARFRSDRMAVVLGMTAWAQIAVGLIAVVAGFGSGQYWPIIGLSGVFALLWLGAAAFFGVAARKGGQEVRGVNA